MIALLLSKPIENNEKIFREHFLKNQTVPQ